VTADATLAADLAKDAGQLLLEIRSAGTPDDPKELGRRGDRESNVLLLSRLAAQRPGDSILSEESVDDPIRLQADRVWIIDPLDGTREFSESRHDWAVHVALWEEGNLAVGAVALPYFDLVLASDPPEALIPRGDRGQLRMAVSRTRPPAFATQLATAVDATLVPMGSAGYKIASVIRGESDVYVHAGGQFEWDSAAPVAAARAAGLHTSRLDGSPLIYNNSDPHLPDLVVCRAEFADMLLGAIDRLGPPG
jgi:3'(2'), 5'-bisphosphate nucleotidase